MGATRSPCAASLDAGRLRRVSLDWMQARASRSSTTIIDKPKVWSIHCAPRDLGTRLYEPTSGRPFAMAEFLMVV